MFFPEPQLLIAFLNQWEGSETNPHHVAHRPSFGFIYFMLINFVATVVKDLLTPAHFMGPVSNFMRSHFIIICKSAQKQKSITCAAPRKVSSLSPRQN